MDDLELYLSNIEYDKRYEIIEVIKENKNGIVEKVFDTRVNRVCIRKSYFNDQKTVNNEYQILKNYQHPNLVKIYDYYLLVDREVIIQEYIDGQSLEDFIKSQDEIDRELGITLFIQLCEVVNYLHNQPQPIIHRDIKPSNIIVSPMGHLTLIDFSISRYYQQNKSGDTTHFGTVGYAAPEQYGYGQTDIRTDIYALGMTFHFINFGKLPDLKFDLPRLSDPFLNDVLYVVRNAIAFDPKNRYQSVHALINDLHKLARIHKTVSVKRKYKEKVDRWFLPKPLSKIEEEVALFFETNERYKKQLDKIRFFQFMIPYFLFLFEFVKIVCKAFVGFYFYLILGLLIISPIMLTQYSFFKYLKEIVLVLVCIDFLFFWPRYIDCLNPFNLNNRIVENKKGRLGKQIILFIVSVILMYTILVFISV